MRNAVKVVVFSCALISLTSGGAHALSNQDLTLTDDPFYKQAKLVAQQKQAEVKEKKEEVEKVVEEPKAEPQPVTHTVASGESLTKIAEQYSTTWKRLFDKNTELADPDVLTVNQVITIPAADEQLAERPLPAAVPVAAEPTHSGTAITSHTVRGSSAGNTYAPGYCTWYAKSRRPDLPNRLGNASAWVASAAAQGFATGSSPKVGAIGQQGNHVVYVEGVNGDGTVTVSEMNYRGLFVISSRTAPASSFRYIY